MSKSKTIKTLSLTGAALAASAFVTVAHADDVATPTVNTDATTSQATDTQVKSLAQAEQNVAITSSDLTVATEAVANSEHTLAITETANARAEVVVTKAEQALDANAQEIAQATDTVKATTDEAVTADASVETVKEALTQAGGQDLADASKALTDANTAVSDAQNTQAKAQYVAARAKENADRQYTGHKTSLHAPQEFAIGEDAAATYINPKVVTVNGVYSDKQYAYQLMLGWTSEYKNLHGGFGHLESLLYSEGDIAFANHQQVAKHGDKQGKGYKEYQDVLHFVKVDDGSGINGYPE